MYLLCFLYICTYRQSTVLYLTQSAKQFQIKDFINTVKLEWKIIPRIITIIIMIIISHILELLQDITTVGQVQRRLTKRLHGLRDLPYTERLRLAANLQSLEVRRLHFDLILCYKIALRLVSINKDDFFQLNTASTRGHPYKLYKPFRHCKARKMLYIIDEDTPLYYALEW